MRDSARLSALIPTATGPSSYSIQQSKYLNAYRPKGRQRIRRVALPPLSRPCFKDLRKMVPLELRECHEVLFHLFHEFVGAALDCVVDVHVIRPHESS